MCGETRIYLSHPCVKFEQIVQWEQILWQWTRGTITHIHTHLVLLILTLFSESMPKLQRCNQVLITRLWCLQAVSKRFMYCCVYVPMWAISMWSLLYPPPVLLGFRLGGTNNDCQFLHRHTRTRTYAHTHTRCSYCVFVANDSSIAAVWSHMLGLITAERCGLALINSTDMTISNPIQSHVKMQLLSWNLHTPGIKCRQTGQDGGAAGSTAAALTGNLFIVSAHWTEMMLIWLSFDY